LRPNNSLSQKCRGQNSWNDEQQNSHHAPFYFHAVSLNIFYLLARNLKLLKFKPEYEMLPADYKNLS